LSFFNGEVFEMNVAAVRALLLAFSGLVVLSMHRRFDGARVTRLAAIAAVRVDPLALSPLWLGVPFVLAFCAAATCAVLALAAQSGAAARAVSLVPPALLNRHRIHGRGVASDHYELRPGPLPLHVASFLDFFTPLALLYVALNRRLLDIGLC
jgi:hypothetical protein